MKPIIIKIFKLLIFIALNPNVFKCIVKFGKYDNSLYLFIFKWFLNLRELTEIKSAYC